MLLQVRLYLAVRTVRDRNRSATLLWSIHFDMICRDLQRTDHAFFRIVYRDRSGRNSEIMIGNECKTLYKSTFRFASAQTCFHFRIVTVNGHTIHFIVTQVKILKRSFTLDTYCQIHRLVGLDMIMVHFTLECEITDKVRIFRFWFDFDGQGVGCDRLPVGSEEPAEHITSASVHFGDLGSCGPHGIASFLLRGKDISEFLYLLVSFNISFGIIDFFHEETFELRLGILRIVRQSYTCFKAEVDRDHQRFPYNDLLFVCTHLQ